MSRDGGLRLEKDLAIGRASVAIVNDTGAFVVTADDGVAREERDSVRRKVARTLPEALKILSDEDRLILKMRMNGFTVAQIARSLHLEQKQLYRRIEKILNDLRQEVERLGLRREDVEELFDD